MNTTFNCNKWRHRETNNAIFSTVDNKLKRYDKKYLPHIV